MAVWGCGVVWGRDGLGEVTTWCQFSTKGSFRKQWVDNLMNMGLIQLYYSNGMHLC